NSREFGWSDRTRDLLFDLVADLPVSRSIVSVMTGLLTGIYGASIGWVWDLIRYNWVRGRNNWWEGISLDATGVFRLPASWMSSAITGFVAGSLVGAVGIVLLGRHLTWRKWLARFVPTRPAPTVADQIINAFSGGFLRGPLIALSLLGGIMEDRLVRLRLLWRKESRALRFARSFLPCMLLRSPGLDRGQ
ncbi:MAG: hypothetical protein HY318_07465, partial [Armatimonadetes bacterium]|nr:hypothetical protein [Armatimonadota bacterium]